MNGRRTSTSVTYCTSSAESIAEFMIWVKDKRDVSLSKHVKIYLVKGGVFVDYWLLNDERLEKNVREYHKNTSIFI